LPDAARGSGTDKKQSNRLMDADMVWRTISIPHIFEFQDLNEPAPQRKGA
jgi:hypothetical protein